MYYLVYQITNKINNKIYIGVHKTNNIDDGYMGSGKLIIRAIKKYGIENFSKTILFEAVSSEEMFQKELELVELGPHSYNLKKGGSGGFDYINSNGKQRIYGRKGYEIKLKLLTAKYGEKVNDYFSEKAKQANKILREKRPNHMNEMSEKAKSDEAREKKLNSFKKIKHQQGSKNSQFGKMWITNGSVNKKIKKDDPIPDGWMKGRKIKI